MRHLGKLVVIALVSTATTAAADNHGAGAPGAVDVRGDHASVKVQYRYGHHILAVDAAAVGLTLATGEPGIAVAGLGGPLVHFAHGNPGRAAASAALRIGLVYGGAALGASTASCGEDAFLCGLGEAAVGAMVGYATAVAIDAGVLARGTRVERRTTWAPQVAASPTGVRVGLGLTF